MIGKVFGKLTVVEKTNKRKRNYIVWNCLCSCGNYKEAIVSDLKKGNVRSCGCLFTERSKKYEKEYSGIYNGIKIIEKTKKKSKGKIGYCIWLVECIHCKNQFELQSNRIKSQKSCGCLNGKHHGSWKGYKDIPLSYYNYVKSSAKKREKKFNITIEYMWEVYIKQDKKCPYTKEKLYFPKPPINKNKRNCNISLDRIDSSKGYIKGNIQWVTKDINFMKYTLNEERFLDLCRKVVNNE